MKGRVHSVSSFFFLQATDGGRSEETQRPSDGGPGCSCGVDPNQMFIYKTQSDLTCFKSVLLCHLSQVCAGEGGSGDRWCRGSRGERRDHQ